MGNLVLYLIGLGVHKVSKVSKVSECKVLGENRQKLTKIDPRPVKGAFPKIFLSARDNISECKHIVLGGVEDI